MIFCHGYQGSFLRICGPVIVKKCLICFLYRKVKVSQDILRIYPSISPSIPLCELLGEWNNIFCFLDIQILAGGMVCSTNSRCLQGQIFACALVIQCIRQKARALEKPICTPCSMIYPNII
mgnify:CR=1 FL=1